MWTTNQMEGTLSGLTVETKPSALKPVMIGSSLASYYKLPFAGGSARGQD
jgi:1,4-dihydroxy-2-naphthoate octaprenyltransferase